MFMKNKCSSSGWWKCMENISVENPEINDNPKYNSKVTSMLKTYELYKYTKQ